MVNKNFNKIVSSLSVWSRMFSQIFGPEVKLRTLRNMPESKSYMLYMCASSRNICERCLGLTSVKASSYERLRPLPVLAPMPTMTKGKFKYLGEEVDLNWKIWMCFSCRRRRVSTVEVGKDRKTMDRIQWYREQQ